jgi:hypothetical protein
LGIPQASGHKRQTGSITKANYSFYITYQDYPDEKGHDIMSVPTLTQSPNAFQQPRKPRPILWIVLVSIIGVLLFAALVGASAFFALHTFFQQTDQPVPVAGNYYLALMTQDYAKAYADLDSQATINGQQVDEQTFINMAKAADAQRGRVLGYSIMGDGSGSSFTMSVQRGGQSYQVHLQLKLEGNAWKIISADSM